MQRLVHADGSRTLGESVRGRRLDNTRGAARPSAEQWRRETLRVPRAPVSRSADTHRAHSVTLSTEPELARPARLPSARASHPRSAHRFRVHPYLTRGAVANHAFTRLGSDTPQLRLSAPPVIIINVEGVVSVSWSTYSGPLSKKQ